MAMRPFFGILPALMDEKVRGSCTGHSPADHHLAWGCLDDITVGGRPGSQEEGSRRLLLPACHLLALSQKL